ncbi:MAG: hypothetical protein H7123_03700 [Thermoleophilia bacterium]|nr:hypothetical protein [Thermoleophilia bacterium]
MNAEGTARATSQNISRHHGAFPALMERPGSSLSSPLEPADTASNDRLAQEALSELLAQMSHEIMTPITTITASAHTLARTDIKIDEPTNRKLLNLVIDQSTRLSRLLEQLLRAQRVQIGQLHVHPREVVPAKLVRESVQSLDGAMRGRIRMFVDASASSVHADSEVVIDVFQRLFENVARHVPGCGPIEVGCRGFQQGVQFWVHDDGGHIAAEEQERIFDRFYSASHEDGTRASLGLGLFLSRMLIEQMGGSISVISHPEDGTTFAFNLPLATSRPAASAASEPGESFEEAENPYSPHNLLTLTTRHMRQLLDGESVAEQPIEPAAAVVVDSADCCGLTKNEQTVIAMVADGLTDREIAQQLYVSTRSVQNYLNSARRKTGVRGRAQIARFAAEHSLV